MKIILKQAGGLAGRRVVLQLDTADLADDGGSVEALARTVAAQSIAPAPVHPDGLAYTLVIDTREVRATDGSATPEFIRLAGEVRARGKAG